MKKSLGKDELRELFKEIGGRMQKPTVVSLLGGGAMCFRNQKNATKDLDVVFRNSEDCSEFVKAIRGMGFKQVLKLEQEYERMGAASIWEDENGFRFDLFVKTVCGALKLSERIIKRSEVLGEFSRLTVKILSSEDVVLFKGITQRPDDVNDIAAIVRTSGVDWDIILDECILQSRVEAWYGLLYDKLVELKEKHGVDAPIMKELLKLDREAVLREAYWELRKRGVRRKEALEMLKERGFTKKELEFL